MEFLSRLIFDGSQIQIGEWRCYPGSRLWDEVNITGSKPMIAFPRSAVHIHQSGRDLIVTSPNQVIFYNSEQTYRRALASKNGDICEYVYLEPALVEEIHSKLGIPPCRDVLRPFKTSHGPCHTRAFLALRSVCKSILAGEAEPITVEETVLSVLPKLFVDSRVKDRKSPQPMKSETIRKHRLQVETVKQYLGNHFSESVALTAIAKACDSSPFHISRVFKKLTRFSILQYLISLRLRIAFLAIVDGHLSLSQIALNCGFSSQSHMSNLFRREFGLTPGFLRKKRPKALIRRVFDS